jgi:hypothetical protein
MDIQTRPIGGTARQEKDLEAEAARYALLHRLAPGLRHQMVAHLQPVEMIVELAKRRLAGDPVDLAQIRDGIEKIGRLSRDAMASSINSVSWLSDDDGSVVALADGIDECVAVLKSGLSFRGFNLQSNFERQPGKVSRPALRHLLSTAALCLADALQAPFEITISAVVHATEATVQVRALPSLAAGTFFSEKPARALLWNDLRALARVTGAAVECQDRQVAITLPLTKDRV